MKGSAASSNNSAGKNAGDQPWYWGNVSKEVLANAMEKEPDGTFAVRDASSGGGFTLTLKIGGTNKLIRIVEKDELCGFTPETCNFPSLEELIQFYSSHSLKEFNELLDIRLAYPLERSREQPKAHYGEKAPSPPMRSESIGSHLSVMKCRLEGLHAEYERVSRHLDRLLTQKGTFSEERQRLERLVTAYTSTIEIYGRGAAQLRTSLEQCSKDFDRALRSNIELNESRLIEIKRARHTAGDSLDAVDASIKLVDESLRGLRPRFLSLQRKRSECKQALIEQHKARRVTAGPTAVEELLREVSLNLDAEPPSLSEFLLNIPLKWDPSKWISQEGPGGKEHEQSLIREKMRQRIDAGQDADGIFLIRPSQSKPGFYALAVSKERQVHNCLVEYSAGDKADYCGYAFQGTNIYFPTLSDFVKYYSIVSLREHNQQLDTRLTFPAYEMQ